MIELKGQYLISTHLDSHGEQLTFEELRQLSESLPLELVINDEHDLSLPSIAVARNLRIVQMENGESAIAADITIHDEERYKRKGGFSMSWLAATYTAFPDKSADIEILFNPRVFDVAFAESLVSLSGDHGNIVARELKQKCLTATAILVVKFASLAAVSGFFGKAGSDVYDALIKRLKKNSEIHERHRQVSVKLQFLVPDHLNSLKAVIILELPAAELDHLKVGSLSFEDAMSIAKAIPFAEQAKKIVIKAVGTPPSWQLSSYEKASGVVIKI